MEEEEKTARPGWGTGEFARIGRTKIGGRGSNPEKTAGALNGAATVMQ